MGDGASLCCVNRALKMDGCTGNPFERILLAKFLKIFRPKKMRNVYCSIISINFGLLMI